jgi:hypothetical protein
MKPIDQLSDTEFEDLTRRAVALQDAPASVVQAAIALFAPRETLAGVAGAALALVRAVLSFDSWAPTPAGLAVRSVPSESRHLVFSAQGRDIDLRIVPSAGRFVLSGQILGPDESGRVELAAAAADGATPGDMVAAVELDALGEFRLAPVPAGLYQLSLRLAGEEVRLPAVEVGAPRA